MGQYLSYTGFKWLNKEKIDKFEVKPIKCNCIDGYILDVDLKYSDELH